MYSMTRHFGLKKVVSGVLLVFNSYPWYMHEKNCFWGNYYFMHLGTHMCTVRISMNG